MAFLRVSSLAHSCFYLHSYTQPYSYFLRLLQLFVCCLNCIVCVDSVVCGDVMLDYSILKTVSYVFLSSCTYMRVQKYFNHLVV